MVSLLQTALFDNQLLNCLLIGFLLVLTIVLYAAFKVYNTYNKAKHIPGVWQVLDASPCYIPILSPYFYMGSGNDLIATVKKYGDKKSGLLRISSMNFNRIVVSDVEMLKDLHSRKSGFFPKSKTLFEPTELFAQHIVSAPDADAWKKHHNTVAPAFSSNNLEFMSHVTNETVDTMAECLWDEDIEKNGQHVIPDTNSLFTNITLDVLAKSAFGASFSIFVSKEEENSENVKNGRALKDAVEKIFNQVFVVRVVAPKFLQEAILSFFGLNKSIDRFVSKVNDIVKEKTLEIERDGDVTTRDVVSLMIKENLNNHELSHKEILSNALMFFIAGTDTSTNTMQWLLFEISKNNHLQKRLQEEVDKVLPNFKVPTFDDYLNLPLLTSCIHETLRCHAPITSVHKECSKQTQLGEFSIPKGTFTHSLFTLVNKNPNVWERPNLFEPDRFLSNDLKSKCVNDYSLMSFSMGLRKCLGTKFALIEITCVIARLLQKYEFELLNDEAIDPVVNSGRLTNKPYNLRIKVTKRKFVQ